MIAPLDWPWLSGTANAQALGTTQPPLPLFTQKHMLFSVLFTSSLSLTNMQNHTAVVWGELGSTYHPSCTRSSFWKLEERGTIGGKNTEHLFHILWNAEPIDVILMWHLVLFPSCSFLCEKASVWVTQFSGISSSTGQFLGLCFCYLPSSLNTLQHSIWLHPTSQWPWMSYF